MQESICSTSFILTRNVTKAGRQERFRHFNLPELSTKEATVSCHGERHGETRVFGKPFSIALWTYFDLVSFPVGFLVVLGMARCVTKSQKATYALLHGSFCLLNTIRSRRNAAQMWCMKTGTNLFDPRFPANGVPTLETRNINYQTKLIPF